MVQVLGLLNSHGNMEDLDEIPGFSLPSVGCCGQLGEISDWKIYLFVSITLPFQIKQILKKEEEEEKKEKQPTAC